MSTANQISRAIPSKKPAAKKIKPAYAAPKQEKRPSIFIPGGERIPTSVDVTLQSRVVSPRHSTKGDYMDLDQENLKTLTSCPISTVQ